MLASSVVYLYMHMSDKQTEGPLSVITGQQNSGTAKNCMSHCFHEEFGQQNHIFHVCLSSGLITCVWVDTLVSNMVHVCYLQPSFTQWPATQNAIERWSCSSVLERSIPFNWTQPDDPDAGTGHESKNAPGKFSKSQSNGEFAAQHS